MAEKFPKETPVQSEKDKEKEESQIQTDKTPKETQKQLDKDKQKEECQKQVETHRQSEIDNQKEEIQRQVELERERRKIEKERRKHELSFEKRKLLEEEKRLMELHDVQNFFETEFDTSSRKKSPDLDHMAEKKTETWKYSTFKRKMTDLPTPGDVFSNLNPSKVEDDEAEMVLMEKIQRLKMKEQFLAERINQIQLEKESKAKKETLMKEERMKKLKEERVKKLKEQEQALISSLMKKESILTALEMSEEEDEEEEKGEIKRKEIKDADTPIVRNKMSLKKPTIPKLTEETFEEWKIEVEVVLKSGLYHDDIIRQEVRNSLSGKTRKILLNVDCNATTRELITKLENIYGNIRTGESVVAEFYTSKQKEKESVAEWGVRVESILNTAIKKGQVKRSQADEMLRNRFWRHLRSEQLRNATRVFYETSKDFEDLRKKVRIEENEIAPRIDDDNTKDKAATSQQVSDGKEQITLMKDLVQRMEKLEEKIAKQSVEKRDDRGGQQNSWRDSNRRGQYYGNSRWNRSRYRGYGRGYNGRYSDSQSQYSSNDRQQNKESGNQEVKQTENKSKDNANQSGKPLNM